MHLIRPRNAYGANTAGDTFVAMDDLGQPCGSSLVVEYINQMLFPQCPLNYYINVQGMPEAYDMLFGAAYAQAVRLRKALPQLRARIYTPCPPKEEEMLDFLLEYGLQNDDAVLKTRWTLSGGDAAVNPPVGCRIRNIALDTQQHCTMFLDRLNTYATTVHSLAWLYHIMEEDPYAEAFAVCRENELLGEAFISAYGAEGTMHMFYTVPAYRRRGVARALLYEARARLMEQRIRSMTLNVWQRNTPLKQLAESIGFRPTAINLYYPGIEL